jgi:1-acyl-sn-glycerol-3-phosphate acyltransferase
MAIPPADLLPVGPRATFAFRLVRALLTPVVLVVFDVRVEGRERTPRGPYVLIANHLNWLDPFVLLLAMPTEPRLHFLANPENLVKNRWHWWVIRQIRGYIPVDLKRKGDQTLFHHVDRSLELGGAVAIFPEAAYGSTEGKLQETWKTGFAFFATKAGAPVLPVALSGTKDLWLRKRIRVVIDKPIASAGRDPHELAQEARTLLQALVPPYTEPAGPKPMRRLLTRLLY